MGDPAWRGNWENLRSSLLFELLLLALLPTFKSIFFILILQVLFLLLLPTAALTGVRCLAPKQGVNIPEEIFIILLFWRKYSYTTTLYFWIAGRLAGWLPRDGGIHLSKNNEDYPAGGIATLR
jgi:hypothetical protein